MSNNPRPRAGKGTEMDIMMKSYQKFKYMITEKETQAPGQWITAKSWRQAVEIYGPKYLGAEEIELDVKTPDGCIYTVWADGDGLTGFR